MLASPQSFGVAFTAGVLRSVLIAAEKGLTLGCPGTCVLHLKRKKRGSMCWGDSRRKGQCSSTELNCARKHDETTPSTSFSRYLLFQLSEDTTEDELMSFKLLLVKELPKSKVTRETVSISLILFKNYYYNPQRQLGCSWGNEHHSSLWRHSYGENTRKRVPRVHMGLVWAGAGHSFCSCVTASCARSARD